jgi:hypothetical protein
VTVALHWNGTTYLPDAGAQRITDRQGQLRRRTNHIENIERPEDLLHDQGHPEQTRTDQPGLGKPQGNGERKGLVQKTRKTAWRIHMKRYLSRYEIELMQNRLLEEQVERLGGIVESRNQAINDIEAMFTDCLRGYNDNVNSEFSVLNGMLSQ